MQNYFQEAVATEKQRIKSQIRLVDATTDSTLRGSLNKRTKDGKDVFYCNRGVSATPQRVYLGTKDSPLYKAYRRTQALLFQRETLTSNLKALEDLENAYEPADLSALRNSACSVISSEGPNDKRLGKMPAWQSDEQLGKMLAWQSDERLGKMLAWQSDERFQKMLAWQTDNYKVSSLKYPDQEICTVDGTRVRSKDECMIYNYAYEMGLPFRYDASILLKTDRGKTTEEYPDFQFIDFNMNVIVLEHLGLMNESWYSNQVGRKLYLYDLNDFKLNRNFFISAGHDGGIDYRDIELVMHNIEMRIWETY